MASSSMQAPKTRTVTLRSADGVDFAVEAAMLAKSNMLRDALEAVSEETPAVIPLPNVESSALRRVLEYCSEHSKVPPTQDLRSWDESFVKKMGETELLEVLCAASYLNIEDLYEMIVTAAAKMIENKSVEDVRRLFNIQNDYTPEEEAELRRECQWAFED